MKPAVAQCLRNQDLLVAIPQRGVEETKLTTARFEQVHQTHDALAYEALAEPVQVLHRERLDSAVWPAVRELDFERLPERIKVREDDIAHVQLERGHMWEVLGQHTNEPKIKTSSIRASLLLSNPTGPG